MRLFFVDDVAAHDLAKFGPMLEHHPIFPERANISLVQVISPDHLEVRTWERGAGLTRACGTAASAAAVAAARRALSGRRVKVSLPGGDLLIEWREVRRPYPDDRPLRARLRGHSACGAVPARRSSTP